MTDYFVSNILRLVERTTRVSFIAKGYTNASKPVNFVIYELFRYAKYYKVATHTNSFKVHSYCWL